MEVYNVFFDIGISPKLFFKIKSIPQSNERYQSLYNWPWLCRTSSSHEFSKKVCTVGYEVNLKRVDELNGFYDRTSEVDTKELKECLNDNLVVTNNISLIKNSNVYIITVPTQLIKIKYQIYHF